MVWYCTREQVKQALDYKETARSDWLIDRAIEAASRDVESLCHRSFAPLRAVRSFDWPGGQYARSWRLWLNQHEVIEVDAITSGGVPLDDGDWLLEPINDGPPFNRIEINLATDGAFNSGDTHQRAIVVTGLWGYSNEETPVGALTTAAGTSSATVTVDGAASAHLGVGSVLRAGEERMLVTGRRQVGTGQTLAGDLSQQNGATTVPVGDASGFAAGETVLVGGERMLVIDVAGDQLVVKRAWDGSTIAAHAAGAAVFAPRELAVQRAALGTLAAAHDAAVTVARWDPPGPVRDLTEALTLDALAQKVSGYARQVGSGDNQREATGRGIAGLRTRVYHSHGRKARLRAV